LAIVIFANGVIHPLDVQQLKWSLRTGKMEVSENNSVENQPIVIAEEKEEHIREDNNRWKK
jgi:hypothetical protein